MLVLGLTGSVGMGKTTTAGFFRDAGVPVFDADMAVHELYRGEAVAPVAAAFPGVARNGVIDRTLLRRSNDPATRRCVVHTSSHARGDGKKIF